LIFKFLYSNLEDKRFCTEWRQAFPDLNLHLTNQTTPANYKIKVNQLFWMCTTRHNSKKNNKNWKKPRQK
jgi:beta-galactosidase beta subunit